MRTVQCSWTNLLNCNCQPRENSELHLMKGAAFCNENCYLFVIYECHWLHKDKVIDVNLVKACTMLKRNTAMKDKQGEKCHQHISQLCEKNNYISTPDSGFFKESNPGLARNPSFKKKNSKNSQVL